MSEEETDISRSTPGYRFDSKPAPPPAPEKNPEPPALTPEAEAFFEETIADADKPVVLFALEWCEFCWAVRKLFAQLGIPYRAVDLDSLAYQENDMGGKIRAVLADRLGASTIPQVFIGGEHVGGATDTFEAYKSGELERRLDSEGLAIGDLGGKDPYELLPNWLHKR